MAKFLVTAAASIAVLSTGLVAPAPALAQRLNKIIVYGTDACPRSTDSEIYVCSRKDESERYRIPEDLREGGSLQSRESWARKALAFETYGRTGINSCSPVGPAGFTGCTQQLINQAFKERREQAADDKPDL